MPPAVVVKPFIQYMYPCADLYLNYPSGGLPLSTSHARGWVHLGSNRGLCGSGDVIGCTGHGQPGTPLWVPSRS